MIPGQYLMIPYASKIRTSQATMRDIQEKSTYEHHDKSLRIISPITENGDQGDDAGNFTRIQPTGN